MFRISAQYDEPFSAQVKPCTFSTDHRSVDFVHACSFCGWTRAAETAVVLPAGCPDCGCAVDSHEGAVAQSLPATLAAANSRALRLMQWAFALALVYTAARAGNAFSGLSGATTAVGIAGFLLLPFVPERLGSPR
jgi:hypothetical protein